MDADSGGAEFVIATGVKKLQFEYWDEVSEDWDDQWEARDVLAVDEPGFSLPPRVRIRLEMYDRRRLEYIYETQATIYVRNQIKFGKLTNLKAQQAENAKNLKSRETEWQTDLEGRLATAAKNYKRLQR